MCAYLQEASTGLGGPVGLSLELLAKVAKTVLWSLHQISQALWPLKRSVESFRTSVGAGLHTLQQSVIQTRNGVGAPVALLGEDFTSAWGGLEHLAGAAGSPAEAVGRCAAIELQLFVGEKAKSETLPFLDAASCKVLFEFGSGLGLRGGEAKWGLLGMEALLGS